MRFITAILASALVIAPTAMIAQTTPTPGAHDYNIGQRKVDQHDAILFNDADQQDDADDTNHIERHAEQHQRQQGAKPRGGQGGDDRERMDRALVEHAEDEINDDQGGGDQDRRARQRSLEGLGVALKARRQRERLAKLCFDLLDGSHCLADGGA